MDEFNKKWAILFGKQESPAVIEYGAIRNMFGGEIRNAMEALREYKGQRFDIRHGEIGPQTYGLKVRWQVH